MSKNNLCQKLAVTCHLMYFLRDQHFLWDQNCFWNQHFSDPKFVIGPNFLQPFSLPTSNLINQTFNSNSKTFQAEHFRWLKENKKLEFDIEDQVLFKIFVRIT